MKLEKNRVKLEKNFVWIRGKWAGDAGVGSARADGSGGWEGDEVW